MGSQICEVPYGRARADSAGASVRVETGVPLRLSDAPYPFDEPPDLIRLTSVADRLDLLRAHLQSLCRPWDKLAPAFLDAYFAAIAAAIHGARPALEAMAAAAGGLFTPEDWSFSAFRPLPQAHFAGARAEIAFWTGARFIAIAFEGGMSPTREARGALEQIEASGAGIVRVPAHALRGGEQLLPQLPPEFARFWEGIALPSSPFGPASLGDL